MVGTVARPHELRDEIWIREELTFGSDVRGGKTVSETEWQKFLDEVVTPRFPEGFSVSDGYGQYRMHQGTIIKEKNWTVTVYVREWTPSNERAIEEIIRIYKDRFQQEAVMRATTTARVRFEES
jgi:hypothetical protein